jgi:hypothetical protein
MMPDSAEYVPLAERQGTHWYRCWLAHHDCAIAEIGRLAAALCKLAEAAEVAYQGGLHTDGSECGG